MRQRPIRVQPLILCAVLAGPGVALAEPTITAEAGNGRAFEAVAQSTPDALPGDLVSQAEPEPTQSPIVPTPDPRQVPPSQPTGSELEAYVPLREALILAMRNNLDVELARIEPAIAKQGIDQARGAFDPRVTAGYTFTNEDTPVSSSFQPSGSIEDDTFNYNAGIQGILPFGLNYSSGYQLNRSESGSNTAELEREFRSGWVTQITLPLIRDLRQNDARVRVIRSELASDISNDVFAGQLTDLVATVENLYWDLAASRAEVTVAQKSLKTAQDLLEQTRVQQDVGVVSRVAVTQAEAGVAERELNAITAENKAATSKDRLLNALLAPTARAYVDRDLIPEIPTFSDYQVNLDIAINAALKGRPDIAEARKRIDGAKVEQNLAENQMRPRLDFVASYTLSGLTGTPKILGDTFRGRQIAALNPNDPNLALPVNTAVDKKDGIDSVDDFFRAGGNKGFSAGAKFEMPIGNQTGRATVTQRQIEMRRARTMLKRMEQTVILEVREAVRGIDSAAKAVGAAERRRAAAAETLRAEQERLRLGDSTPFQVLEFEEDLAEAERQLIDSLRAHRNAITRVEQVQGTLLSARGVDVQDELNR